jgi:hypothetical protein
VILLIEEVDVGVVTVNDGAVLSKVTRVRETAVAVFPAASLAAKSNV